MIDDSLMAWLGPAAEQLTAEQLEQFADASRDVAARYPGADDENKRQAALNATVQYLLGIPAEEVKRELVAARLREREAYAAAVQHAVMARRVGGLGTPTAAKQVGIDRQGLGRVLGER